VGLYSAVGRLLKGSCTDPGGGCFLEPCPVDVVVPVAEVVIHGTPLRVCGWFVGHPVVKVGALAVRGVGGPGPVVSLVDNRVIARGYPGDHHAAPFDPSPSHAAWYSAAARALHRSVDSPGFTSLIIPDAHRRAVTPGVPRTGV
jgi:hypothetical protein